MEDRGTSTIHDNYDYESSDHPEKSVAFSTVTVYEFPIIIGDNPACSAGCPIALGGLDHLSAERERIDMYMYKKRSSRTTGSGSSSSGSSTTTASSRKKNLCIPPDVRTRMLLDWGFGLDEVIQGTTEVFEAREQRQESLQKTAKENIKNFFKFTSSSNNSNKKSSSLLQGTTPALNAAVPSLRRVTAQASTA